jgi:hypothetical protein
MRMERYYMSYESPLKPKEIPQDQWKSDDYRLEDCKNLVRVLAERTEILYRECRFDRDKASHIRAMASTLAALTVLVNRIDLDFRNTIPDILKDTQGFAYHSVRSCDLDRICDK